MPEGLVYIRKNVFASNLKVLFMHLLFLHSLIQPNGGVDKLTDIGVLKSTRLANIRPLLIWCA